MSLARSYAQALFEAAREQKLSSADMEKLEQQSDEVKRLIDSSRDLHVALLAPSTPVKDKVAVIGELSKRLSLSSLLSNFLTLLARKERLTEFGDIRDAFSTVRLEAEGGILGKVVSADPMESVDIDGLAKAFSAKLGKKVAFRVATDPTLLAGIRVTVSGVTYDGTVRTQLQRLRDRLTQTTSGLAH